MTYSKTIENIVKELNTFLLQLKETTEYTKNQNIIICLLKQLKQLKKELKEITLI